VLGPVLRLSAGPFPARDLLAYGTKLFGAGSASILERQIDSGWAIIPDWRGGRGN